MGKPGHRSLPWHESVQGVGMEGGFMSMGGTVGLSRGGDGHVPTVLTPSDRYHNTYGWQGSSTQRGFKTL